LDLSNGARPAELTLHGASQSFSLPGELISAISSLAARYQATPFMLLLAAFKVLLYRYSRQPDVLVGVPVAGRSRVETEGLIGFFVDTVVLRDDLSGNPHFLDLLAQVRQTTLGGLANADVPFEKVVEAIQPQRDLSYNPIFQVMFSVVKSAMRSHAFGNLTALAYVVRTNTSIFDLFATFIEDNDRQWWLQIDYNTTLFQDERVRLIFEDYAGLLQGVVADPEARIESLPLPNAPVSSIPAGAQSTAGTDGHKPSRDTASSRISRPRRRQVLEPTDQEQALLLEIWEEVLGRPKISIHDNFFDWGALAARCSSHRANPGCYRS
jgi:non-ribosomal peptide synthetase component F